MNYNFIIIYITLIIFFIIMIFDIIKSSDNINVTKINNDNFIFSLIHLSTERSRILDTIRDASIYLNIKPTFVSLNQIDKTNNNTIHINSTTTVNKNNFVTEKKSLSNYNSGYVGGYQELSFLENYLSADSHNYIIDNHYIFSGKHGDTLIGLKLLDFINNNILYIFNFSQTFGGYFNDNSYRSFYASCIKIKNIVQNNKFIIVGDFNVQGWEEVVKYVFDNTVYISGNLKFPTCNDNEGLASPDGLIVSKNFCKRIIIDVVITPFTFNKQHYLFCVKFYNDGVPGMYLEPKSTKFLNYLINNIKDRDNLFINYKSKWDKNKHTNEDQNNYWKIESIDFKQKPMYSLEKILTQIL